MKREHSVWIKILIPLAAALMLQSVLIMGALYAKGTIKELENNEISILNQKVINRAGYLHEVMLKWTELDDAINALNDMAEGHYVQKNGNFSSLDSDQELYTAILSDAIPELIQLMRRNEVNGAFLILSTQEPREQMSNMPGAYLRDLDAISSPPEDYSDIQALRMPAAVARQYNIANHSGWKPNFKFDEGETYYDFLKEPYEEANRSSGWDSCDLGYWSGSYILEGDGIRSIAYSVPLRLSDGMVYGVLGVEVTEEYLGRLSPYKELNAGGYGGYILGKMLGENQIEPILVQGPILRRSIGEQKEIILGQDEKSKRIINTYCYEPLAGGMYYGGIKSLELNDGDSPYEEQQWAICGLVRDNELLSFSDQVEDTLRGTSLLSIAAGLIIVIAGSMIIARPLTGMVQQMKNSDPGKPVRIPRTRIRELNELGDAIGKFSSDVFEISSKFSQIVKLASVELAAFEVQVDSGKLFVTDDFFSLFGRGDINCSEMKIGEFYEFFHSLGSYISKDKDNETIYEIPRDDKTVWVRLRVRNQDNIWSGLAENITDEILALKKVEFERDYDPLTNLLNRRALSCKVQEVLKKGRDYVKTGAMMLLDMDNLKLLNDNYGHDWGDRYLQLNAVSLRKYLPENALISRMSGDEFLVFFYGFENREELREVIKQMEHRLGEEYLVLPDSQTYRLRMSGGIAWYPDDGEDYLILVKYADFAMYKVKNSIKGKIWDFDKDSYLKEYYLLQNKEELNKLIEQEMVTYYFQPIVEAATGRVYAYEALMRSNLETIPSVKEVLTLARQEFKLRHIERLTWFQSMKAFMDFRDKKIISPECKVFINTIPNQILPPEDCQMFEKLFKEGLANIVQEVTEEEKMNEEIQEQKIELMRQWGAEIAIDDYGTGYNSQTVLLALTPDYVKVDMSMVRNIDRDDKKRSLVKNTISYARERDIRVIAEGVETYDELKVLVELGADYLQGYYYGKPSPVPEKIDIGKKQELIQLYDEVRR